MTQKSPQPNPNEPRRVVGHIGPTGKVEMTLHEITKIGIDNIFDLESYGLSKMEGRTMHLITFRNGATCEITYADDGTLEIFHGLGIGVTASPEGSVVIDRGHGVPKPQTKK